MTNNILGFLGDVAFPTAMKRMREREAGQQVQQLLGQQGQQYQPGAGQGMLENIPGTGLLGGQLTPQQFGAEMMGIPGREQLGAQIMQQYAPKPVEQTILARNVESATGYPVGTPQHQQMMERVMTTPKTRITMGDNLPYKLPAEHMLVDPSQPHLGVMPIPGSKAARTAQEDIAKVGKRQKAAEQKVSVVTKKVDEALDQTGFFTTGLSGFMGRIVPGTEAYDLGETVKTIQANLGFDELQKMREASPTGGALGQVAIQELELLKAAVSSVNPDQSEDVLRRNLMAVKRHFQNWKNIVGESNQASDTQSPLPPIQPPAQVPVGLLQGGMTTGVDTRPQGQTPPWLRYQR